MQSDISMCFYLNSFGITRKNAVVVYGLSQKEAMDYVKKIESSDRRQLSLSPATAPNRRSNKGRKLVLEPYLEIIRDLIRNNPMITTRQISSELRRRNVLFSQDTAIKNLLSRYEIALYSAGGRPAAERPHNGGNTIQRPAETPTRELREHVVAFATDAAGREGMISPSADNIRKLMAMHPEYSIDDIARWLRQRGESVRSAQSIKNLLYRAGVRIPDNRYCPVPSGLPA